MHSEDIKDLALALNKMQANLEGAVKGNNNPFFKSSYADLSSVWEACRVGLADSELAVTQTMDVPDPEQKGVIIVTTLMHSSGQWIKGELFVPYGTEKDKKTGAINIKQDPQALGSAITYGRRYALMAMLGICPVDDDGESAMDRTGKPKDKSKPESKSKIASKTNPKRDAMINEYLNKAENMQELLSLWEGLTADEKQEYASLKDKRKAELSLPKECTKNPETCEPSCFVDEEGSMVVRCQAMQDEPICKFNKTGGKDD